MADSQIAEGLKRLEEVEKKVAQVLPPSWAESYGLWIKRFENARVQRDTPNKYFDDLGYVPDYLALENAKNTYLRPKANDSETRVNTGTLEKKIETVQNELLAMNLQHEVRAFDQNDLLIAELGQNYSDIITRTNQMEKDDDFWIEATAEMLSQRAVFLEDTVFPYQPKRSSPNKIIIPRKRLVSGLKVFLGDPTIPLYLIDEQPYIVTYDRVHYTTAEAMFGGNPLFKHVKYKNSERYTYLSGGYQYRFGDLLDEEVEVIHGVSVPEWEEVWFVNGVMLTPPNTKPSWSYPGYKLRGFALKSNHYNFAYGRPLTAQGKTLQAVDNESLRLLLRKFQQSLEPPMAVPKGKIYSRDIWDPAALIQGLRKDDFQKLIDHDGPTQSELAMYNLITQKTEEFVGASKILQGMAERKEMPAAEVLTLQKQGIKMLGHAVATLMRMKRDMVEQRIYTLQDHFLKPTHRKLNPVTKELENVYRAFTLEDANLGKNKRGTKVVQFSNKDLSLPEKESLKRYEEEQEEMGNNIRVSFVNVNKLSNLFVQWYIVITSQEKEGSALDKVLFQEQMTQAAAIQKLTGVPLEGAEVIESFERKWKAKNWFQRRPPMDPNAPPMGPEAQTEKDPVTQGAETLLSEIEGSMGSQVSRGLNSSQQQSAASLAQES